MIDSGIFLVPRRALRGTSLLLIAAAMLSGCGGRGGAAAPIKVACIGDSITYGSGIGNPSGRYPSQLSALLGDGTGVGNFGHPGATLLTSGNVPYQSTKEYANSLASPAKIIVIMLGTNDAKPGNWAHQSDFVPDYVTLIAQYRAMPTHPVVYVCLPPPVYSAIIPADIVQSGVLPAVRQAASQTGCPLIDNNAPLQDHPEWFSDGIHPNVTGAGVIAKTVDASIKAAAASGD